MLFGQFTKMFIVFAAVALLGLGCKKATTPPQSPPEDANPQADAGTGQAKIPEGWQIYRNPAWGVEQLAYPPGWHYRERTVEETGDANALWVDFNQEPIEPLIGADPVYPLALVITTSTLEEAIGGYQAPDLKRENVTIGDKSMVKISYTADLIDAQVVAYLYASDGLVYDTSGSETLPELATMVASLTTGR